MAALCRDCGLYLEAGPPTMCPGCGSRRCITHAELDDLAVAHVDCDAFYAAVEKRDNPDLQGRPVVVGGRKRGVVMACCYVARMSGVRSAMPMFEALRRCPDAVVVRPDMAKYRRVGGEVRDLMHELTPLVEPLSVDEAFLDLSGTESLHGGSPARTLARLAVRIEREIDITVSIGLSYNKFLAKLASDLDKPRGFALIGRSEALGFLETQPISLLWGVGRSLQGRLRSHGIHTIGQLRAIRERDLVDRYGAIGHVLARFACGADDRRVTPGRPAKSISAETTLAEDVSDSEALKRVLWLLCETVSRRLKGAGLAGGMITLKLKCRDFRQLTRSRQLGSATTFAEELYQAALPLLTAEADGRRFRLIGIGAGKLSTAAGVDFADLIDADRARRTRIERAMDAVRDRFGVSVIGKGRGWPSP